MPDFVHVEIKGQPQIERLVAKLDAGLDLTKVLDEAAALMLARNRARFLQQVDPNGAHWKPSHAAQHRAATGRGGGTLYDTGRLFHSIQVYKVSIDSRAIGTNVPYAPAHNYGIHQEVRTFLGFNDEDTELAGQLVLKRVLEELQR